jgi:hypothetical protein
LQPLNRRQLWSANPILAQPTLTRGSLIRRNINSPSIIVEQSMVELPLSVPAVPLLKLAPHDLPLSLPARPTDEQCKPGEVSVTLSRALYTLSPKQLGSDGLQTKLTDATSTRACLSYGQASKLLRALFAPAESQLHKLALLTSRSAMPFPLLFPPTRGNLISQLLFPSTPGEISFAPADFW